MRFQHGHEETRASAELQQHMQRIGPLPKTKQRFVIQVVGSLLAQQNDR